MKINNLLTAVLFLFISGSCITQLGTAVPEKDENNEVKEISETSKDRGPEDTKFDCGFEKISIEDLDGKKRYFIVPRECVDQLVDNVCDPSMDTEKSYNEGINYQQIDLDKK
jgi:hypothetical protein